MRSAVWFAALLSLVIVGAVPRSGAQGQATPPATPPPQGQPPAGQPGGQRPGGPGGQPPQNLKVLPKTWTGQQVRTLMQTFVTSLGQTPLQGAAPGETPPTPPPGMNQGCLHCHAQAAPNPNAPAGRGPGVDYVADTNPNKDIARTMIEMVMKINDTTKDVGDKAVVEKVTCWTCHQGKPKPAIMPENGWGRGGFSLLPAGPPAPTGGRGGF